MTSPSARHLWWFVAVASFLGALGKAADADWLGALSGGCIALAIVIIALAIGRGRELSSAPKALGYILLGISIAITAGRLLGVLPNASA